MFRLVGRTVSRIWLLVLLLWIMLAGLAYWLAPDWSAVTLDGEFVFLPSDSPSRLAEDVYRRAFPDSLTGSITDDSPVQQNPLGSTIVIIVRRTDLPGGLTDQDREFIENRLRPELEEIARTTGHGYYSYAGELKADESVDQTPVARGVWTQKDRRIGPLLSSEDGRATLILMELKTEFLDRSNSLLIHRVEELVREITKRENWGEYRIAGLDLAISGSAVVGRDMLVAEHESAAKTEWFTKALVVALLLAIYRAPLLALIPLLTVGLSVEVTIHLLRMMAGAGWIGLFHGIEVYVTVVVYGAGVDYCLFLIARYQEELESGLSVSEAAATAVDRVGTALATSAGTSICGIGMMMFADFGKFQQAGFAISFGLLVVLCAAVTFTPALLLMAGRWAFWPDVRSETVTPDAEWRPGFSLLALLQDQRWLDRGWQRIADLLLARPAAILIACIALLIPFAVVGAAFSNQLSYGLLSDLPQDDASVVGAKAIQHHFAAGIAGPTTVLLYNPQMNIPIGPSGLRPGEVLSDSLAEALRARAEDLDLADVRSQKDPLGAKAPLTSLSELFSRQLFRNQAMRTYLSGTGEYAGDVIRFDLVFDIDPFSRDSVNRLTLAEAAIRDALPAAYFSYLQDRRDADWDPSADETDDELDGSAAQKAADTNSEQLRREAEAMASKTQIWSVGPTAGIRDLKNVTDGDQHRIYVLVILSVYLVMVALLRKPAICGYLIVSVAFSYFVTLGVTFAVFWLRDPSGFAGLDWKVPIFLFTILIAMGEDYNILLMARVEEEQRNHPPVEGIRVALTKTGSIISSCGIIMAGTFATLMAGTLLGMVQLGFALAFGVLLDTFVV
ncbi:MAG: MMPL family transporter, partial [Planctomycetaceae bacterium]|nr:MMPL family transporter [Planctomycetaceae bacterium]